MNTLPVIAVHGVGMGDGDDRKGFSKDLKVILAKGDPCIAENWHECVWEDINDKIDKRVCEIVCHLVKDYLKPTSVPNARWWHKALNFLKNGGWVAGGLAATLIVDLVSDFLLYLDTDHGKKIRARLKGDILKLAEAHPRGIALVAHSLGSVIAYDVVSEAVRDKQPLPIKQLITFGSPLAWTFELRNDDDKMEREFVSVGETRWTNFYYREDYVPLHAPLPTAQFPTVENRLLELPEGKSQFGSHTAYWKDEVFAAEVKKLIALGNDPV